MTLRLQTFLTGLLAWLAAALLALGAASANPASGGYQLFEPVALEHQADIQLASLENFNHFAKIASECCNAPNRTVDANLVSFGRNSNQNYHTWRHIDDIGMDRTRVKNSILDDVPADLATGPHQRRITVDGVELEYRIFKFDDGSFNVGTIFDP